MEISVENFKANWKVLNRQNQQMTLKPRKTFGLFKLTSSVVMTVNLEFNSWCNKVYSHKSGRVARQPYRWSLECGREQKFIGFLVTIHEVHIIERETSKGKEDVVQEEIDENSSNYQTWECGLKCGPKLESISEEETSKNGQSRSQNSTTPEDGEYKETIKKRTEKIGSFDGGGYALQERDKISSLQETEAKSCESNKIPKTKRACIVEAHESTRQRLESSLPKIMKITLRAKDIQRGRITVWFTNSFLCRKRWKFRMQKQQWTRNRRSLRQSSLAVGKVKSGKGVILEAQRDKRKVHFAILIDIGHLKNAELEPKFPKYKGRVVLRGGIAKDDSGSYAVLTEQGSSASQMTAVKVMDVIARLLLCMTSSRRSLS